MERECADVGDPANDDRQATGPLSARPTGNSVESYGCRVNELSTDALFVKYQQAGFLYPAKLSKLAPFLPLVMDNWRKARRGGELLQWVRTYDDPSTGDWSSVSSWLSSNDGWVTQHLVSMGSPLGSRAVMLATAAVRLADHVDGSHQSWFRRGNRYANRIFGAAAAALGEHGWIGDYGYFHVPTPFDLGPTDSVVVSQARSGDLDELRRFLTATRSRAYVQAEGLADDDISLDSVDQLYRRVGLRRYRKILIARDCKSATLLGAALAYRGPLGLNFSFLENRCDLAIEASATPKTAQAVCHALCGSVREIYQDFEPRFLPILIDLRQSPALAGLNAEHIRDYAQSIWLNPGFEAWYKHTEQFYDSLIRAGKRRGLGARSAALVQG